MVEVRQGRRGKKILMAGVGILVLTMTFLVGIAVQRHLLGTGFAEMLLEQGISALSERDREAAARYNRERSDLISKQKVREAELRASTAEVERAYSNALAGKIEAEAEIIELERANEEVTELMERKVPVIVEKIRGDPQLLSDFNSYREASEQRIKTANLERDLAFDLLEKERTLTKRLIARSRDQHNLIAVLQDRVNLSEKEVKRLRGRKIRFGPGAAIGIDKNLGFQYAFGASIVWG